MASGSRLLAEQRRRKILEFIEHKGQITVRELASRFSVSAVTARGDLDSLCSSGLAIRSHGGDADRGLHGFRVRGLQRRDRARSQGAVRQQSD